MKILFIYIVPSGGMETLNRERCKSLQPHGVNCHLLYLIEGSGLQNFQINSNTIFVTNEDNEIRTILEREQYDCIIVSSDYMMLERLRVLGYWGPIIYEAQGLGNFATARNILLDAKRYIEHNAVAVLYPNTTHLISLFREIYPDKRHYCFDNCLNTEKFSYRSLDFPSSPIIGWVGRIESNKNWQMFLDIVNHIRGFVPDFRIWLFEDDKISPEKKFFNDRVDQLKLNSRIERFSNVPHHQMADYYSIIGDSGGFLCSTSVLEGFGYAVLEAMSCRCPVVTSDSDGIRSFVTHNVTGKLFAQQDLKGAVMEAFDLLYNLTLREFIRSKAITRVSGQFSPQLYADRFLAMLQDLNISDSK